MGPDWTSARDETVSVLQSLIQFDTTNPPGNELPLARHIAGVLEREGIDCSLLVPVPERAAIVARLAGTGAKRPLILLAHMDVVGVERAKWSHDPFGGVIADGYLYGRGATDDKGMLAANLVTMLLLKRQMASAGLELERDVVFVATSDEETDGSCGIRWLVAEHRELLDAEFAINEGGRTRIVEGGRRYLAIQTAEKISHMVTLTAHGPAGHAAIPLEGNAVFHLGRALARLSEYREPVTLTETTRRFFAGLCPMWPDAQQAEAMACLVSEEPEKCLRGSEMLSRIPVFNAVMRNGISATQLVAGVAGNVIPAEATAVLNVRTIPGHNVDDIADRIRACIDDPRVQVSIAVRGVESPASDADSAMFTAIAESAKALDPNLTIVPYLSTGRTDSAHLRRIGIDCYGILPFPMAQADEERMHGHDERVALESLHFGTRLIYDCVRRAAAPLVARG